MSFVTEFKQKKPPRQWREEWPKCPVDGGEHFLVHCAKFRDDRQFSVEQREELIERARRCRKCFSPTHGSAAFPTPCTWKRGRAVCEICGQDDHHTLLHRHNLTFVSEVVDTVFVDQNYRKDLATRHTSKCTLRQAVAVIRNPETGSSIKCNCLLDGCCA